VRILVGECPKATAIDNLRWLMIVGTMEVIETMRASNDVNPQNPVNQFNSKNLQCDSYDTYLHAKILASDKLPDFLDALQTKHKYS
jgi:hypothetical protein